jgi:hypothetical protein
VKLLLILGAAAVLSGCRFWYKPVPVANAIGEEQTVLSGDSLNLYRSERFEVYGPSSEAVYDGYEQMNRAYRAFERFFGAPAPRLAVFLSIDSTLPLDSTAMIKFRERGFSVLPYVRPRSFRAPTRYGALGYGGVLWPIAPTAARALLARFAHKQLEPNRFRSDSLVLDRLPLWYRAAVIHLVGEAGAPANDLEFLRQRRAQWMPLQQLLTLVRPSASDSLLDPSRRAEADEVTRIVAAQATTFARFLIDREGIGVLGRLGRGYLSNRSLNDMIAEFRTAPRSVPELEKRWKTWVELR